MVRTTSKQTGPWEEQRRFRAWELSQQGWSQVEIAEALGVDQSSISRWLARAEAHGEDGLRTRKREGPKPRLSADQRARLLELLAKGAEAFGFAGDLWTLGRIAELIHREFDVAYHRSQVCRILKACGWSVQKPEVRATQRDEAAIAQWRDVTWPDVKKRPRTRVRPSSSSTNPASTSSPRSSGRGPLGGRRRSFAAG
jgi:transposase